MNDLITLRDKIDEIDSELLALVAQRIEVVRRIGEIKKAIGKPVKDEEREQLKIAKLQELGKKMGLAKEYIEKIWKVFFEIAYKEEK